MSAPWFSAQVAVDLLARQMWITVQMYEGADGAEAARQWDADELLTDTYEEWEAKATEALRAAAVNRRATLDYGEYDPAGITGLIVSESANSHPEPHA